MPAIKDRGEGNMRRKDRLAKLKKGPGVFRYLGTSYDLECIPTPLMVGRNEPVLDGSGMPVVDGSGRQVFKRAGTLVTDSKGNPVLGGIPTVKRTKIETFELWGVSFPEGEPVTVTDDRLALKLRGMDAFEEVEPEAETAAPEPPPAPRKKPGPKPKAKVETEPKEG